MDVYTVLITILGQVGGVAISAAVFQSILNVELHKRIHGPDAETVRPLAHSLPTYGELIFKSRILEKYDTRPH